VCVRACVCVRVRVRAGWGVELRCKRRCHAAPHLAAHVQQVPCAPFGGVRCGRLAQRLLQERMHMLEVGALVYCQRGQGLRVRVVVQHGSVSVLRAQALLRLGAALLVQVCMGVCVCVNA